MDHQQSLFDAPRFPALARAADPSTSQAGADAIKPELGKLQQLVLTLVAAKPGRTANELTADFGRSESLRKRFHELCDKGLIEPSGERRCRITGKQARTWRVM